MLMNAHRRENVCSILTRFVSSHSRKTDFVYPNFGGSAKFSFYE